MGRAAGGEGVSFLYGGATEGEDITHFDVLSFVIPVLRGPAV